MRTGVPGFQGQRLQQAREGLALSKTSLAALVDVSVQAISQYEKGVDLPGKEVFDRLRQILKQEAQFFLKASDPSLSANVCFYRSLAVTTRTARNKAEVWKTWSRELISYVASFIEFPTPNFPSLGDLPPEPHLLGMDRIESIAADVREHWSLGEGPISNLVETAENNGAVVFRHSLDAETLDALSEWLQPENFPLVVLNADKNVAVRSRLDLGHELGHMFLHRGVAEGLLRRSDMFRLVEDQAFRFGAALLLPEHSFLEDLYSVSLDALLALKLKWKVSVAMMIERLKDLNIVNVDQHRRLRINYSARRWNKEEPYDREIKTETPEFLGKATKMMLDGGVQTIGQFSANTGFSQDWIERLLSLPPELISQKPKLKLLNFERPA
jgi:Zn-dependent peptidase ImmA (M78 family)/transcriptional regulator with XRE-family HTH domain